MLQLIYQGQWMLFLLILVAIVLSLSFHEFGHAATARLFGDDTAQRQGRLTLNPVAHIDPVGLLMVMIIGFGYARPVPTNPAKFSQPWAGALVAAAGPLMNLVLAFLSINLYVYGLQAGWSLFAGDGARVFFTLLAVVNLILMIFNLLPLGPLDGHYILPSLLPAGMARRYSYLNQRYGGQLLLVLVVLSLVGVPVFSYLRRVVDGLLPLLVVG